MSLKPNCYGNESFALLIVRVLCDYLSHTQISSCKNKLTEKLTENTGSSPDFIIFKDSEPDLDQWHMGKYAEKNLL